MKKLELELKKAFVAYRQHRNREALVELLICEETLKEKGYHKVEIFKLEEQFAKELDKVKNQ